MKRHRKLEFHNNVLRIFGITKSDQENFMLVLEYANNGPLRHYLEQNFKSLKWHDKLNLAKQLVSVVTCLHDNNIIHMNLHSENILIHNNNIKLSDFGTSKRLSKSPTIILNLLENIQYVDPQYIQNIKTCTFSKSSDIYSVGILLWEISRTIGQSTSATNITSSLYKSGNIMNSINIIPNPLSKELEANDNFAQIFIKELFQIFIIQFNNHEFQKDIIHNLYKFIAKTGK
ncbi:14218_t:CDS:2, partial [Dentiscutata heterogama]